ncbi:MAG: class I SAM-dependent methyltransferase [Gemmatimonadetes bacterium]|nr:class I SAM-dependent methyltransferase [Gemmatimonadota bacterium]MBT8404827.1 class I SAM-dependent methyltransferase [Gemmatimonadota bacterium]NNF37124.1 methyltransferase domain-containing protein [Gemmatimonadota bacterium]NNK61999.1 methyltransferase domain-containing protein [Gemmatimonadota bacterium]
MSTEHSDHVASAAPRPASDDYVLGRSPRELDRLDRQGALYRPFTRELLLAAGIGLGDRVLDLGSGSGDVSFLAHELVAPLGADEPGEVVGVELDAATAEAARARAERRGFDRVRFRVAPLDAHLDEPPFDAIVGRFILMHQRDPAAALRRALIHARPGAAVAFLESSMTSLIDGVHSRPFSGLYERIVRWKGAVVAGCGGDLGAGLRLREIMLAAGLPSPSLRFHAHLEGGSDSSWYAFIEESVRSMLPQAERLGIEGFTEMEVDGLADALRAETVAANGVLVGWPVVAAWSRVP